MSEFANDLRLALRSLRRSPGFAAAAIVTLGIGAGASTAIFTLLKRTVLDPLPYPEAHRLVRLKSQVPGVGAGTEWQLAAGEYFYFGRAARTLDGIGAFRASGVNLLSAGQPRRASAAFVSSATLELLGGAAARGRLFDSTEYLPGARAVAVLSYAFWRQEFGGAHDIVGRTIQLDENPYEVIGVMRRGVELPLAGVHSNVWLPMRLNPAGPFFNSHVIPMIARIAPGATPADAQTELNRLNARLPEVLPTVYGPDFMRNTGFATVAYPLKDYVLGAASRNLWVLFGAVGLLLLIAYGNVANLLLVRSEARRREIGIRIALGATRAALARHYLAESLLIAFGSGVLAVIFASWGVDWLTALAPEGLPRLDDLAMDTSVLLFTAGLSFIIAVGLAAFPTLQQRVLGSGALAEGGRSTTVGRERRRARHALVMGQVALALVLIVGAVLLVQSYRRLQKVDPGIDPLGTLALQIYLPPQVRYNGADSMWRFYGPALENIRRLPGVTHAGLATALPFTDTYGCTVQGFEDSDVFERIRGRLGGLCADMVEASPGYFESLRIPVLAGRVFTTADIDQPERGVVVVSKTFAERFWGHENPLGRGVIPFNRAGGRSYRVIGVVGDVHPETLDDKPASAVYYPMRPIPGQAQWWPSSVYITVRTGLADPEGLLPAIRTAVAAVDPAIPIANALDMTTIVANSMSRLSFMLTLIAIAATVALLLAAVGLYGVISYTVAQRTNEIGVRIALGAAPAQVERFVVNGALRLMGMGVVAGVAVALLVTRVLRSLLFGVSATDPVSFVAGAVLLSIVALAAAWVPARRAARVDPMVALRSE